MKSGLLGYNNVFIVVLHKLFLELLNLVFLLNITWLLCAVKLILLFYK